MLKAVDGAIRGGHPRTCSLHDLSVHIEDSGRVLGYEFTEHHVAVPCWKGSGYTFLDELYDLLFVIPSKNIGLFLWKFFDIKIIDGFGPDGISSFIKKCSLKANKFQSGFIYHYAFVMLLGFSALLTFLIVK